MIPIRDNNPTRIVPFITWTLVAANVFIFFLQMSSTTQESLGLIEFALIPREVVTGEPVGHLPTVQPAWITIFTSMFLHGGLLHLGSNMLYLIVFGNNIEDRLGHVRFLLFYLASGFFAAIAHIASGPGSIVPTVGASGAVAGVLGAYFILYPRAGVVCLVFLLFFVTTIQIPAVIVLGFWILGQIMSASAGAGTQVGGGIAYWAHIGGFFAGILLLFLFDTRKTRTPRRVRRNW